MTVRNNGCIYVPQLTSEFKTSLIEQGKTLTEISKSCKAFSKYLDVLCTKTGFSAFCKSNVTRLESLYIMTKYTVTRR